MIYILIFLISALASLFGSIIGFGGGIFVIPILIIFFDVPINVAVGSVIIALFPAAIISSIFNIRKKNIDYLMAFLLEIPTMAGTVLGAYFTSILPHRAIEIIFCVIIGYVGLKNLISSFKNRIKNPRNSVFYKLNKIGPRIVKRKKNHVYRVSFLMALVFGLTAGILAGLLGIGGGFLKTPIMMNVFGLSPAIASATALFMIVFTSFTGSVSHFLLGHINLEFAIPLIIGFSAGAFAGNIIGVKLSEKNHYRLIALGLLCAAIAVFINVVIINR